MPQWHFNFRTVLGKNQFKLSVARSSEASILGLYGPSGSGKTTLIKTLLGLTGRHAVAGSAQIGQTVLFDDAQGRSTPIRARRLGWVPQTAALFPHLTAAQNLHFARKPDDKGLPMSELLDVLDLGHCQERRPHELSGGERQRVALGRALAARSQALLLDEPFTGLDDRRRRDALTLLQRLNQQFHLPMIYVSHNYQEMERLCTEVWELDEGVITTTHDLR